MHFLEKQMPVEVMSGQLWILLLLLPLQVVCQGNDGRRPGSQQVMKVFRNRSVKIYNVLVSSKHRLEITFIKGNYEQLQYCCYCF